MANEKQIYTETFKAGDDYSSKQYYGCKLEANRQVALPGADTAIPAGIILNKPADGEAALVLVVGRAPGVVAEPITAGQLIRIDQYGKVALFEPATDTTCYCCGQCLVGAGSGSEAQVGEFMYNFANPWKP